MTSVAVLLADDELFYGSAIGHMPMVRAEASFGGSDWCLRSLSQRY
jgi:hypothetical protein